MSPKPTADEIRKLIRWCVSCGKKLKTGEKTACKRCEAKLIKRR